MNGIYANHVVLSMSGEFPDFVREEEREVLATGEVPAVVVKREIAVLTSSGASKFAIER